jgi:hypothetical protein
MNTVTAARRIRPESTLTPLESHPRWLAACEKVRAIEERYARAKSREQAARARLRSQAPVLRSSTAEEQTAETLHRAAQEAEQASALAEGRELAIPLPPSLDLDAALEEQRLLTRLLVKERTEREAVRDELDAEANRHFVPEVLATLPAVDKAHEDLYRALRAYFEPLGRLQGMGYRINPNILPVRNLGHSAVPGDPDRPETIAGRFRAWLRGLRS